MQCLHLTRMPNFSNSDEMQKAFVFSDSGVLKEQRTYGKEFTTIDKFELIRKAIKLL